MQWISYGLDLFAEPDRANSDRARYILERALAFLVEINSAYLATHPAAPALYDSGVLYEEEPPGVELFQSIPKVLETMRHADCDDLACWRVAELRAGRGREPPTLDPATGVLLPGPRNTRPEMALVHYFWRTIPPGSGHKLFHVQVRRADGSVEDPSAVLGMPTVVQEEGRTMAVEGEVQHPGVRRWKKHPRMKAWWVR